MDPSDGALIGGALGALEAKRGRRRAWVDGRELSAPTINGVDGRTKVPLDAGANGEPPHVVRVVDGFRRRVGQEAVVVEPVVVGGDAAPAREPTWTRRLARSIGLGTREPRSYSETTGADFFLLLGFFLAEASGGGWLAAGARGAGRGREGGRTNCSRTPVSVSPLA